jgi:hypothetical protein
VNRVVVYLGGDGLLAGWRLVLLLLLALCAVRSRPKTHHP